MQRGGIVCVWLLTAPPALASGQQVTANEVAAKVAEAEATEREIDATRELYRPVAARASLLFFCIADLAAVDPMYQYSLAWFIGLFVRSMEEAPKVCSWRLLEAEGQPLAQPRQPPGRPPSSPPSRPAQPASDIETTRQPCSSPQPIRPAHRTALQAATVQERGDILNAHFTYSLYLNVCRSLFERHKLMFAFLLAVKISQAAGAVDPAEWRFLLAGPTSAPDAAQANPAPGWLTDKSWGELQALALLPAFKGLLQHFCNNLQHYKCAASPARHVLVLEQTPSIAGPLMNACLLRWRACSLLRLQGHVRQQQRP
jgi:dynein heavy chain